jgi:hypothetical protein
MLRQRHERSASAPPPARRRRSSKAGTSAARPALAGVGAALDRAGKECQ